MELVVNQSEDGLVDLLSVVQKAPGNWVSIHINMARTNEKLINDENISLQTFDKIRNISVKIAKTLLDSKLQHFEGKVFVFNDNDILALFIRDKEHYNEAVSKLREEFAASGMDTILSVQEMDKKLGELILLSEEKHKSAKEFKMKHTAVSAAETIFSWKKPDPDVTKNIQQKRTERGAKNCVLIVEDDIVALGMVTLSLRDKYNVVQARDAKSAIISYINNAPDMVFLDIHLPDRTGHEVLNRIMLLDPQAYVVMLSGDSVPENVISTREQGAAGFVKKPFLKEKIMAYTAQCPALVAKSQFETA